MHVVEELLAMFTTEEVLGEPTLTPMDQEEDNLCTISRQGTNDSEALVL